LPNGEARNRRLAFDIVLLGNKQFRLDYSTPARQKQCAKRKEDKA
jgi:hypothetical protein